MNFPETSERAPCALSHLKSQKVQYFKLRFFRNSISVPISANAQLYLNIEDAVLSVSSLTRMCTRKTHQCHLAVCGGAVAV